MKLAHPAHDAGGAVGEAFQEPLAEQARHLSGQAQDDAARGAGSGLGTGGEDRLQLVVGERRDDGRDLDADGDAGLRQAADGGEARDGEGTRGSLARDTAGIERRHRQAHMEEPPLGHGREEVEVTLDQACPLW
jgi:hypothetical protein